MNEGMISRRYARALLQYAVEQKVEDTIFSEMKKISSAFASEPKLRIAMENPVVSAANKQKLIEACVGGNASPTLVRFIGLVEANKRVTIWQNIALSYQDLYCESKRLNMGRLVTASPVASEVVQRMKTLLQKVKPGTIELEATVDPGITGGFILYIDTYRYDASVSAQLARIKKKFVAGTYAIH